MLARLGNVIYWAAAVIGTLFFLVCVYVAFSPKGGANPLTAIGFGAVAGGIIWVIGYACRYVLAGR